MCPCENRTVPRVERNRSLLALLCVIAAGSLFPGGAHAGSAPQGLRHPSRPATPTIVRSLGHAQHALARASMALTGLGRAQQSEHGRPLFTVNRGSNPGNLAAAAYADGKVDLRLPDAVGNLFRTEHRNDRRYGPAGQLLESWTPEGVTRYDYDPEGNLVRKREPDGSEWRYDWNGAGMLSHVTRPDGAVVEFAYDALGRRVSKTYRGKVTRWIWDGNVPLHEWVDRDPNYVEAAEPAQPAQTQAAPEIADKARAALRVARPSQGPPPEPSEQLDERLRGTKDAPITWLFEPESFAPLGKLVGDERFGIVTDHLGTPSGMFDASGKEVWGADIDVYGDLRNLRGAREACPFRWPGQYEDSETGLYYNRFRYYDREAGQYASQDPIRLAGGSRIYGYVRDPNRWMDPGGLSACGTSYPTISTPYGAAEQASDSAALAARAQVERGATLYRIGTMGRSEADKPQFWALEHPLTPGYPARYGIPPENVERSDFIETATLRPGTPFVTRAAPPVGMNPGGGIEVVVPEGGATLESFSTKGAGW